MSLKLMHIISVCTYITLYWYICIYICIYKQTYVYTIGTLPKYLTIEAVVIYIKYKSGNRHRDLWDGLCVSSWWPLEVYLTVLYIYIHIYICVCVLLSYGWLFCLISNNCTTITTCACTRRRDNEWSSDNAVLLPFKLNFECGVCLCSQCLTSHDCLRWYGNLNLPPVALWYGKNNSATLERILTDIKD